MASRQVAFTDQLTSTSGASGTVQTANGSGGLSAATNVLAGSGFISVGTSGPAAGYIRLDASATIKTNTGPAGTEGFVLRVTGGSSLINFGDSGFFTRLDGFQNAFYANGSLILTMAGGLIQLSAPILGDSASSPFSAHGNVSIGLADADHTLSAAEYALHAIRFTGALTALRTITFPAPAAGNGYGKLVLNMCTGANGKHTYSIGSGTTVTPFDNATTNAAANAAWLWIDSNGVHLASSKFAGW